jgi:hypothetical protein
MVFVALTRTAWRKSLFGSILWLVPPNALAYEPMVMVLVPELFMVGILRWLSALAFCVGSIDCVECQKAKFW